MFYLIKIGSYGYESAYTTKRWHKWRLSTKNIRPIHEFTEHNLVTEYLENNEEAASKYLDKEVGYLYLDILKKAEEEKKKMREIKFRQPVWIDGKFSHWHHWGWNGKYQHPINTHDSYEYTGLKDKNGKEIYEGDIVEDVQGIGVVGFSPPCFTVQCRYNMHYFLGAGNIYPENYKLKTTKIIGNIYENPELLK